MLVWRYWERVKNPGTVNRHVQCYRGLFLLGFIPLFISSKKWSQKLMKIYILTRCDQSGTYKPRVYTTREAAVACMVVEYEDTESIYEPNCIDKAEIGTGYAQISLKRHDPCEEKCFDRWDIWEIDI